MIVGLNRAYGIKENRRWWRIVVIAFGLTVSLEVIGLITLGAMVYASFAGNIMREHLGLHALVFASDCHASARPLAFHLLGYTCR